MASEKKVSRRKFVAAATVGAAAVGVAAVGLGSYYWGRPSAPGVSITTAVGPQTTQAPSQFRLGVVLSSTPTSLDWASGTYEAAQKMKAKYNIAYDMTEFVSNADAERVIRDYANRGFNLVWMLGAQYEDPSMKVAKDFPKTFFVVSAGMNPKPPANVVTLDIQRYQVTYLFGALSAMMTKSNYVASIAGIDYPVVVREVEGFKAGVRATKPGIKLAGIYTGTWTDPVKGKEVAKSVIQNGADFINIYSGLTNRGIIDACNEAGVKCFNQDYDAWYIAPSVIVSTCVMKLDVAMDTVISQILKGQFQGGRNWAASLKEGMMDMAPYHNFETLIPQDVKDKISQMK